MKKSGINFTHSVIKKLAALPVPLALVIAAYSPASFSKTITIEVECVAGEHQTLSDVKQLCMIKARRKAMEQVGQFVERSVDVEDSEITQDTLSAYSASLMEGRVAYEKLSPIQSSAILLTQRLEFTVDMAEIRKTLEHLDRKHNNTIASLAEENLSLMAKLEELSRENGYQTPGQAEAIAQQRSKIVYLIESNRKLIRRVVEGSLYDQALASNLDFEIAKRDLDLNYFDYIRNHIDLKVGEPYVSLREDGKYDVSVYVSWALDGDKIFTALKKHFGLDKHIDRDNYYVRVLYKRHMNPSRPHAYSEKLAKYLLSQVIAIEVSLGEYTESYNITLNNQYKIQFLGGVDHRNIVDKRLNGQTNPIQLQGLSDNDLKRIHEVRVQLVIKDNRGV